MKRKETTGFQPKTERSGKKGLTILWEQELPPSKRTTWKVSIGGAFTEFSDFMAAHTFWEEA